MPDTGPRLAAHQNATSSSLVTSAAAAAAVAFSAEEDRNLMSEALTSRLTRAAPSRSVHSFALIVPLQHWNQELTREERGRLAISERCLIAPSA